MSEFVKECPWLKHQIVEYMACLDRQRAAIWDALMACSQEGFYHQRDKDRLYVLHGQARSLKRKFDAEAKIRREVVDAVGKGREG